MTEKLKAYCNSLIKFSEEELKEIDSNFVPVKISKKEFFIREGKICNKIGFINKGSFRHFHIKDGSEYTCDISIESTFITEYSSFSLNKPSHISFQALEDSEVFIINKNQLEKLYEINPKFVELGRKIAENTAIRNTEIAMSLASAKPESRYKDLMNRNPEIFNRVQQKYIANFLGITPESLSRIRKRVQTKKS